MRCLQCSAKICNCGRQCSCYCHDDDNDNDESSCAVLVAVKTIAILVKSDVDGGVDGDVGGPLLRGTSL